MKTGGTSLAAPVWAALIAIADQGRVSAGGTTLDGASQVLPALYALPAADFHDVTAGGNGVFEAGPGYDQSTGLGSPLAGMVAPALAYYDLAPWLAIGSGPPSVVAAGQPFGMTVEVENSDGSLDANFVGSVTIRLGDDPGGDALGGTLTEPAIGGYATFNGLTLTLAAAGYTILAASVDGPASATTAPVRGGGRRARAARGRRTTAAVHGPAGLTVAVLDVYGNLVTSYDGGVTLRWGSHGRGPPAAPATPGSSRWPAAASPPSPASSRRPPRAARPPGRDRRPRHRRGPDPPRSHRRQDLSGQGIESN